MNESILLDFLNTAISVLVLTVLISGLLFLVIWGLALWFKWKDREEKSLKQVNLMVAVPQDNEVKIDAMEQILNSFGSMYKSAKVKIFQSFIGQPSASLEIVGTDEDIKFYVSIPEKYQDLIEKQIYSVYAGADIKVVEEPNIYTKDGVV